MGGPVIRTARALHAWAGAILALLMIVLSLSGSLLVWKEDYLSLSFPQARGGFEATPENLAGISRAAEDSLGAENIRLVVFGTEHHGIAKAYLHDGGFAYLSPEGAVLAQWHGNARPEEWLFDLHHHLLAGHTGELISGIAGLAMAVLIIAGLIAYWPTRKALKLGFSVRSLSRPHLLLSHRNIGLVTALPALILILTGASMVFGKEARTILSVFGTEDRQSETTVNATTNSDWLGVYETAAAEFPEADIRMTGWPTADAAPYMRIRQQPEWHPNGRSYLRLSEDGSEATRIDAMAYAGGERIYHTLYPLHSAKTGGLLYKIAVFITGMALTFLGMIGLVSFAKRFTGKPVPRRTRGSGAQARSQIG